MCRPLGVRIGSVTSPACMVGIMSATKEGSCPALRQPSAPPSSAVPESEYEIASCEKSSPFCRALVDALCLGGALRDLLLRCAAGSGDEDVREVVLVVGAR